MQKSEQENVPAVGFREMLRRHQESQLSHIDRIRRNIPSAQQARSKLDDLMAVAANEEAMRVKNEHAYARAI